VVLNRPVKRSLESIELAYRIEVFETFAVKNQTHVTTKFNIDPRSLSAYEPIIATTFGAIPHAVYYLDNTSRVDIDPDFISALIRFSERLAGKPCGFLVKRSEDIKWDSPELPPDWTICMCIIIRAITHFILCFDYVRDDMVMENGEGLLYEQYGGEEVLRIGSGDCEDLAWLAGTMLELIEEYKGTDMTLLSAQKFVQCYVICFSTVLVTAGRLTESALVSNKSFLHGTCLLIPKEYFISHIASTEEIVLSDADYACIYPVNHRAPAFGKYLERLHVEATGAMFPDPTTPIEGVDWEQLSKMDQRVEFPLYLASAENTKVKSRFYLNISFIYTEFVVKLKKVFSKYIPITTEFLVTYAGNDDQYPTIGGVALEHLSFSADIHDFVQLYPTCDIRDFHHCDYLVFIRGLEPPPPHIALDSVEFDKILVEINPAHKSIWFQGYVSRESKLGTGESEVIPFLPYNLANASGACKVKPKYIHIVEGISDKGITLTKYTPNQTKGTTPKLRASMFSL